MIKTPTVHLGSISGNEIFIKREDLIPFSFGGNKARKAELFFQIIDSNGFDCVVTYGTGNSNHCRVIANECCRRNMPCYIISPEEEYESTFNLQMMRMFGADVITVPISIVHETIELQLARLKDSGNKPYFIEGGGHGNIGTAAYVQCYDEIIEYEKTANLHFDYIFLASGTGTTQAGLVCGQILNDDDRIIVGISIARKNPRGRNIVIESIHSYLDNSALESRIQDRTIFIDEYTEGYGKSDIRVTETIKMVLSKYGLPLDMTYTGKAFMGMNDYIKKEQIMGSNILFIHTGGTPLFFDTLKKIREDK